MLKIIVSVRFTLSSICYSCSSRELSSLQRIKIMFIRNAFPATGSFFKPRTSFASERREPRRPDTSKGKLLTILEETDEAEQRRKVFKFMTSLKIQGNREHNDAKVHIGIHEKVRIAPREKLNLFDFANNFVLIARCSDDEQNILK